MSAIQDIQSDESRLEMTPMIDVTFLLLIFFLTTIRFKSLEGKLAAYLPKGHGPDTTAPLPDPMQLTVKLIAPGQRVQESDPTQPWEGAADGNYLLEGHAISFQLDRADFANTAAGREALTQELLRKTSAFPDRALKIYTDPGVLQMDVVGVLDVCHSAHLTDIMFAK